MGPQFVHKICMYEFVCSSCCNFVQKVMPYHSNLERTALASCFTENCCFKNLFTIVIIVHKSVNNIAPIYISELLKVYTASRNLRSSNISLLKEPTSKRTWGDRSFSVAAPTLWNHLSTKLKSCHSITRFKSLLKTHLMSQFVKDDVYL